MWNESAPLGQLSMHLPHLIQVMRAFPFSRDSSDMEKVGQVVIHFLHFTQRSLSTRTSKWLILFVKD